LLKLKKSEFQSKFHVGFKSVEKIENIKKEIEIIAKIMIEKENQLEIIFKSFDKNNDKKISKEEFELGLKEIGLDFQDTNVTSDDIFDYLDQKSDGFLDLDNFKNSFTYTFDETFFSNLFHDLINSIYDLKYNLKTLFRKFDIDNNGTIDFEEFKFGLLFLLEKNDSNKKNLNDSQIKKLFDMIDTDGNGDIDYNEFLNAFFIVDTDQDEHDDQDVEFSPLTKIKESLFNEEMNI
jgi:Ca2+-binding EF-hand superfamily protein